MYTALAHTMGSALVVFYIFRGLIDATAEMATDPREVDPKSGGPHWSPMKPDQNSNVGPGMCGRHTKMESTDTTTPAMPASDNNWRWARRIEVNERIAEAALRKEEAAAIRALEQDG